MHVVVGNRHLQYLPGYEQALAVFHALADAGFTAAVYDADERTLALAYRNAARPQMVRHWQDPAQPGKHDMHAVAGWLKRRLKG
jgi:hypothetical protein